MVFLALGVGVVASGQQPLTVDRINDLDSDGLSLLHKFAMAGSVHNVDALLEQGADPRIHSSQGMNALHYAAYQGHPEVLRVLLAGGAEVDGADSSRRTALYWAVTQGHPEAVRVLASKGASLDQGPSEDDSPMIVAIVAGEVGMVRLLRELGSTFDPDEVGTSGRGALHVSAMNGVLAQVEGLLAAGADVNLRAPDRATPLLYAATLGHADVVAALVEAGAKIDAQDTDGFTPLIGAATRGDLATVRLLVDAGSREIESALVAANLAGKTEVADYLADVYMGESDREDQVAGESPGADAARRGIGDEASAGRAASDDGGPHRGGASGRAEAGARVGAQAGAEETTARAGDAEPSREPEPSVETFRPDQIMLVELPASEVLEVEILLEQEMFGYFDIVTASDLAQYTLTGENGEEVFTSRGADAGPFSIPAGRHRLRIENPTGVELTCEVRLVRVR